VGAPPYCGCPFFVLEAAVNICSCEQQREEEKRKQKVYCQRRQTHVAKIDGHEQYGCLTNRQLSSWGTNNDCFVSEKSKNNILGREFKTIYGLHCEFGGVMQIKALIFWVENSKLYRAYTMNLVV
jgi:hypothetical protein